MIPNHLNKLLFIVALLTGQISAAQEVRTQSYLAKRIPASSKNCHDQAAELAQRFTSLTRIGATGRCESTSSEGNDILIQYQSSERLNVVTSATEIGFPGQGYEFSSKALCEGEIQGEMQAFKNLTGHEPLLAFCRGQENYYGRVRWALIVEGFGAPEMTIQWASSLFPGLPSSELSERIKNDVKDTFSDQSLQTRHVFLQDDEHGHLRLTVNYYGAYGEQVKAQSLVAVNTLDQCHLALDEMQRISDSNTDVKTLSYCVNNPYRRGADLVVVVDVTRWYNLRQSAESFASYEECAAAKPALLDTYRSHYPQTILGGFCSEWGPNWKINLLEKP